jgi:tetratricopeptide (TPR) repeat protein
MQQDKNKPHLKILIFKILTAALTVFFTLIIFEIGLRLTGFALFFTQEYRNNVSLDKRGAYRIMCLGESSTALGGKYSYPRQLEEILNRRGLKKRFSVVNAGAVSADTADILTHLEGNLARYKPDMVVIMAGANDRYIRAYEDIPDPDALNGFKTYRLLKAFWAKFFNKAVKEKMNYTQKDKPPLELHLEYTDVVSDIGSIVEDDSGGQEAALRNNISLNPFDEDAYYALACVYSNQARFDETEAMLKKAISLNPGYYPAYFDLGRYYLDQRRYGQAEEMFKKTVALAPHEKYAYYYLGWAYANQRKIRQAEQTFKKVAGFEPPDAYAYYELGNFYNIIKRFKEAAGAFSTAIDINPHSDRGYCGLGEVFLEEKKFAQGERMFLKAIEANPGNTSAYRGLVALYKYTDRHEPAEDYCKIINNMKLEILNQFTHHNYHKIADAIRKKGIKLVCVQYPLCSLKILKRIMGSRQGIIFVDNDGPFRQVLSGAAYEEYFIDRVQGGFSHCTPKGNRILAENISQAILAGVLNN